ncbi:hypothetical protein PSN45_001752 [Yamadazyma tenuis]|uniref:Uncharacterized protein n=1 Tax=Candida tenuis (strain ATCC 10573 / BCRC 21748 / CBS 615 / JCM 9827 / NBRC 10315 / NRRL Y-1498 / VKM Y-70) TaxID=590646 RepID=G3BE98_CANTC|nr:uncharacterized protein CANTEDRAFT_136967 [Yamadazyma tenuis ATCC 10573]EGV60496.1 hypothetical protein CANTEDRAFT_136967 [Yamadazyma tenuis ATCC 10573]WEJ94268.1 hypothetical protein PSN45_001752 [Yamadazyma tenuis]
MEPKEIITMTSKTGKWFKNSTKNIHLKFLVTTLVSLFVVSFMNFEVFTSYQADLNTVDIIHYLSTSNKTVIDEVDFRLPGIIQDSYSRNQDFYASNYETSTIIFSPSITISKNYINIHLSEGHFNFTTNTVIRDESSMFHNVFSKTLDDSNMFVFRNQNLTQFIRAHLLPFYEGTRYLKGFEEFDKFRLLIHLSNMGVLFSSTVIMFILIIIDICYHTPRGLLVRMCASGLFCGFITSFGFQILNLVTLILMNSKFPNKKLTLSLIMVICGFLNSICLSILISRFVLHSVDFSNSVNEVSSRSNPQYPNSETSSYYPSDSSPEESGNGGRVYSGSIQVPKTRSPKTSNLTHQRSYTAPLLKSPAESDSTGFEQLKSGLYEKSSFIPSAKAKFSSVGSNGEHDIHIDPIVSENGTSSPDPVDSDKNNEDLKLRRVSANSHKEDM